MDPLTPFYTVIEDMKKKGLYNTIRTVESAQGAWFRVNGKKVLNFCSNNYLGLAANPWMKKAAIAAIRKYGVGPGAVRVLSGTNTLHLKLEEEIARFKKAESAIVVQSGFNANIIAIQTIMGKEDIVISDELNHASIIDAIRLSQISNKFIYRHNDMEELEERLKQAVELQKIPRTDGAKRIILIVTDGVFSMDGDIAPLDTIVVLAKKYGAKGINISGICCTAAEVLMRHGVSMAGNFLQQELAIITGAVEAMIVDVQCIMPSLPEVAKSFHTKLISTSPKAKFVGMEHIEFAPERALEIAKEIVTKAVENFKNRDKCRNGSNQKFASFNPDWIGVKLSVGVGADAQAVLKKTERVKIIIRNSA